MTAVFSALHLMRPEWLWALLPAVLLIALMWYFRGKGGSWTDVIAPQLLPYLVGSQQTSKSHNLLPILLLAWIIAAVAAAGPAWKKIPQPIHQKQDALVLVLDLSYSMMAQDLSPSRLIRTRQKLLDLLEERGEGQTGLIAYAGDSHIVTPLTDDNPTIANLIPALNPQMMPVPGSDPASAVKQAIALLRSAGISAGKILLITDGVDRVSSQAIAKTLSGTGVSLAVLGIGTRTGAPIPLPQGGFIKDDAGNIVIPTLDEAALRSLASNSGGSYARISLDDQDIERLLSESLPDVSGQNFALERTADAWEDQGYLLVLLLLPVALALFRRGWVICLLPFALVMGNPTPASAQSWDDLWLTQDQQGRQALQRDDNEAAASLFKNPDWAGTAAYRNEDYERSVQQFSETNTADSWYNRGNALAKSGKLDEAIKAYKQSLELRAEQRDAIDNIELLEKMKEQQEQEQEQQEQEQEQDQDQDQEKKDEQEQNQDKQGQPDDKQQSDEQSEQDQEKNKEEQKDESEDTDQSDDESEQEEPDKGEEQKEEEAKPEAAQNTEEEPSPEDQEKQQAMEQWLRRIPDDPSGLLREKFRYESRQREQQGKRKKDDTYW